jgi:hypothetical protein
MKIIFTVLLLISFFSSFAQVTFTDVAPTMGVDDVGNGQGVSSFDFNNDGYIDIFLVNNGQPCRLYRNDIGVGFIDVASTFGVNNNGNGRGCATGDFNNDGWTDIVIGNYSQSGILYRNDSTAFTNVTVSAGMNYTTWGGSINWFDYNNDSRLDCYIGNDGIPAHANYLFENNDLSTFSEVAASVGLTDDLSTLSTVTADYDNDGDLDIFIGNQSGSPTGVLFQNNGGSFTDVSVSSGLETYSYTWGADWGDFDNDGDLDLYLANSNTGNQCFVNNGDGTFTESAAALGIDDATSSFSCGWADFDNDGDLDLYVANASSGVDKLYRNDGATFTDVAASVGTNDTRHSNSTTWADFNNDGFLDLYLSNNGSENRLYMSNAGNSNHWLELKLVGVTVNRSAIGARVRIVAGGSSQIREVQGGSGHNGQNSLPAEFGLGAIATVDSIIVNWPGGPVDIHTNIAADQIITVTEGQPIVSVELSNFAAPVGYVLAQNYPNPFNPSTTIEYSIPERTDVKLAVINIVGEEVMVLVNQTNDAGNYRIEFNAAELPSGVYFYRLQAGNPSTGSGQSFITSKKMVLLK